MTYSLDFDARALKEWQKLGDTLRQQLKKKLVEILNNPRIEANRLHSLPDCYKIKLRSSGYRLVYQVIDQEITVFVVAVDKRERDQAYRKASERLEQRKAGLQQIPEAAVNNGRKRKNPAAYSATGLFLCNGGEIGIRTLGTGEGTTDFESVPFGHSGISPTARIITA